MALPYAISFYKSKQWKKCRASFISKCISQNGGLCSICNDRMGYLVHHKKYITPDNINNPDITLNHYNLQYLCTECHNKIHSGDKEVERYYFDSEGNVQEIVNNKEDV